MFEKLAYVVRKSTTFDLEDVYKVYAVEDRPDDPDRNDCSISIARYVPPVYSPVSSWYIAQFHGREHSGLDINLNKPPYGNVELGESVYAVCNGLVVYAQYARGNYWGNLVIVASIGARGLYFWRYAHLQDIFVAPGDIVSHGYGTHVGTIGKGANDRYDAHLHIDCWRGHMIAPEAWLDPQVKWIDPLRSWPDWKWGTRG